MAQPRASPDRVWPSMVPNDLLQNIVFRVFLYELWKDLVLKGSQPPKPKQNNKQNLNEKHLKLCLNLLFVYLVFWDTPDCA